MVGGIPHDCTLTRSGRLGGGSALLAAQVPQKMFCVHVAGDKLGALTHDFRQNGFAVSVNGCHFGQFNDALFRRFEDARLRKILAQAKQEMVAGRALQETDQYGMIF